MAKSKKPDEGDAPANESTQEDTFLGSVDVYVSEIAPRTIPSAVETLGQFEAYALALGKVAHAWNYLFERLGELFVAVVADHHGDRAVATAIWYSPDSDRTKLSMLGEAMAASPEIRWQPNRPKAKADVKWVIDRTGELMDLRNNIIHAPCVMFLDGDAASMTAFSGHMRAKKLWGKEILVEFDWCFRWSEELSRFSRKMGNAVLDPNHAWPDRPGKPDRASKKALLSRLLPKQNT